MKKVLITGGKGFLGSRFADAHRCHFEIYAPGSQEMNILDIETVETTFSRFRPDYVIHAAARPQTDYCNENPALCYQVNVEGTENIAIACRNAGSKMIFISTEQVFNGNRESGPFQEDDDPCPDTVYGQNKLKAEKAVEKIIRNAVILRLTWLFGVPSQDKPVVNNILWDTYKSVLDKRMIHAPIHEYRGMTSVDELIEKLPQLLELPPGLYHTGSENRLNRYETVCFILKEMGLEDKLKESVSIDSSTYRDSPRDVRLNTGKLHSAGIRFTDSEQALRNCIDKYNLKQLPIL